MRWRAKKLTVFFTLSYLRPLEGYASFVKTFKEYHLFLEFVCDYILVLITQAMKKVTEGQGQQHFIDRMENQEKQRLMNLQQQARHLEELRGTKKSSGKVWVSYVYGMLAWRVEAVSLIYTLSSFTYLVQEKVANDFFQRLEKFERDREERIKAKKEAKYVSPVYVCTFLF